MAFVQALIKTSVDDGNAELTKLLQDLAWKIENGEIVYPDDGSDNRPIGEEYDVVNTFDESPRIPSANYIPPRKDVIRGYLAEMEAACKAGKTVWEMVAAVQNGTEKWNSDDCDLDMEMYLDMDLARH